MKSNKLSPSIRVRGFAEAWNEFTWADTVNISTKMINPTSGIYDEWWHVGPGNIESFTGEILNNIRRVKDEKLISNKFIFQPGDVIYSKIRPQLAKYALPDFQGLASADAYVLNTKNGLIPEFLYLILHTSKFYKYSTSVSMRTGMPKINREELNQYAFYIPSTEEQKKINELFKKINKTISFHQQELDVLKQTKQGFLQKMFPKDGETVPEVRFNDFTGDWKIKKINDIATETFGGGTPKTVEKKFWSGDIPWIQSSDIIKHQLCKVIAKKTISEEAIKSSATKLIPKDSIAVVTRVGVGKLGLIEYDYSTSQDFVSLSNLRTDKWFTVYSLYKILQRELHNVQGTSIKGITKNELLEKRILLPKTFEEQVKIGEFFKQLDEVIDLKEQELEALKQTKKGFLQKMFV